MTCPAHRLVTDRREVARLRSEAMAALDGVDALMVPTAPLHPRDRRSGGRSDRRELAHGHLHELLQSVRHVRVSSVPAGTAGDAQFGVTVLARAFDDAVAIDIAALVSDGEAQQEFGRCRRPTGPSWWCSVRTCAAGRWFTSSPTSVPGGPARVDHVARVPHGGVADRPRPSRRSPGCPTARALAFNGAPVVLSPAALGRFLAGLPAPMQLGKVEFDDGTWRTAFGCDGSRRGSRHRHQPVRRMGRSRGGWRRRLPAVARAWPAPSASASAVAASRRRSIGGRGRRRPVAHRRSQPEPSALDRRT